MRKLPLALALLALPATLAIAGDRRAIPAAEPAGKPLSCVRLTDIRETRVRSDQVIDFVARNGRVYRNTLPQGCPGLGFEQRFSYATSLSQLCSVDIITVLQMPNVSPGASCGLGQFQPVTLANPRR
jgi:hypothetical protein